ncbi:mediator complex, subunit Med18 [Kalaharituber pfeilii]|nr:mediator complex, subunit Med18 [Kalaharituber pfeilii]
MQELSLYALIPNSRHAQILRIFSGICNMNPEPTFIHHLIFRPKRPKLHITAGTAQAEMHYLQLISKIDEAGWERKYKEQYRKEQEAKGKGKGGGEEDVVMIDLEAEPTPANAPRNDELLYDIRKQKWTMQFLDFPEAMRTRPVTTRNMYLAEIGDGNALAFMDDLGYTHAAEYVTSGYNLYHQNLIISLTQTLLPTIPHHPLPRESLKNLDPAQAWVCEVSVRVSQAGSAAGSNKEQVEVMNMGVAELKKFQELVRGVGVELEMGERLALDTRVR